MQFLPDDPDHPRAPLVGAEEIGLAAPGAERFGRGAGAALMREALARGVRSVDVNEQNPRARCFYEKHGFQTVSRRETDDCGNPYPILRMELAEEKN